MKKPVPQSKPTCHCRQYAFFLEILESKTIFLYHSGAINLNANNSRDRIRRSTSINKRDLAERDKFLPLVKKQKLI
jgi:hypothetical protein